MVRRVKRGWGTTQRYGTTADVIIQIGDWQKMGKDHFTLEEMVVALGLNPMKYKDRRRIYNAIHRGIKDIVGYVDGKGNVHKGHWDRFVETDEYRHAIESGLTNSEIWELFVHYANLRGIYLYIADDDWYYYQPDYVSFHAYRNARLRTKAQTFVREIRIFERIGGTEGMKLPGGKTLKELSLPISQAKALLSGEMGARLEPEEENLVKRDMNEVRENFLSYYVKAYDDIGCPFCRTGKIYALKGGDYKCNECKTIIKEDEIEEILEKINEKYTEDEKEIVDSMKNNY